MLITDMLLLVLVPAIVIMALTVDIAVVTAWLINAALKQM